MTTSEMKLLLGFILWKPTSEHYFTKNSIFSTPGVKKLCHITDFEY